MAPTSSLNTSAVWDVIVPPTPCPMPGVRMAGFADRGGDVPVDHRAIPHPAMSLMVEFGAAQPVVSDAHGRERRGSLVLGLDGLTSRTGQVHVRGRDIACVQVRISPLVAASLLDGSPRELSGVIDLEDVWGRTAIELRERLALAPTWRERFTILTSHISRSNSRARVDGEVAWAWRRISATRGRVRVTDLAEDVGWSRKRLWARFRTQIGLSPKQAGRLVRFDHAARRLAAGQAVAAVAAECGYADQSHLHRETVAHAGLTPRQVHGEPWLSVDPVAWPENGRPHDRLHT